MTYIRSGQINVSDKTLWILRRVAKAASDLKEPLDPNSTADSIAEAMLLARLTELYPQLVELYDQREQANKKAEEIVMERLKA